ncbi:Imm15 family immunity protein [Citrobacter portucalensis]|uniref:Imm15 family immunity protein n=1 Tax=Citrobacter portucalensis TaxID=1639133 RepID=UPI001C63C9F4|nr:Imm15 family immunity protein [Citrobacter portucalensis]MBW7619901.1 hypothetical protein [Citrobacter portucalensis]MBW7637551.1 hypothetical protein [Citrobacter portucalensis]MCA2134692.1 immunity 15 family protein [Citrobacter portucalensis]MCA2144320.1 immunity 15 family protein [Citrobacter portucalensis]MCA2148621.1 immunity 15 family protein [Citrobacter portucalensis]
MSKFDKEMQKLIKKEGLNDSSIFFSDYETFEEIPLFSRWKNISFLSSLSFNEKNKVLIKKGLELIADGNSCSHNYMDNVSNYFICLSLTNWDDYEEINCLTPNIFISRRKEWLLSNLKLRETQTIEENIIREYLFSLGASDCKVFISDGFSKSKRVYIIKN